MEMKLIVTWMALALTVTARAQWVEYASTPCGTVYEVAKPLIDATNVSLSWTRFSSTGYQPVAVTAVRNRSDGRWVVSGWQTILPPNWHGCLPALIPATNLNHIASVVDEQSVTEIHSLDSYMNDTFLYVTIGPSGYMKFTAVYSADVAYQRFKLGPPPNTSPYHYTRSKRVETFKEYLFEAGPVVMGVP